ncbi:Mitochondrial thiamine pyrophosphate carrier 1 [Wickerhamiella sorbophila]|uniref:Mitochondrial thiamine pyrophosphate carrier 1 n=1 Tax=Wickerhamiella sorbophila TaxID=45607 RepID=A0A2T0FLL5_9ASCO|nr:Mitochondrial thiamine pyrophosphate carrier 1 [Wickerhamiella sorbophila]PRT55876.1 Mitochondrial thiamine pyrophosphate carrier 1 [Wickerhamiella sorbophila]
MAEERPNPVIAVVSGGTRALTTQFFSFYIRVPVKLFRPARIDYTQLLRRSLPAANNEPWSFWRHSNPAMLVRAVRKHGWEFIPDKLLPPILANSVIGAVLYSTYLSALYVLQASSGNKQYPTIKQTAVAGALAGGAQALVATPLDAITTRFDHDLMRTSTNLWKYGAEQLKTLGPRAAYGGITLNLVRECSAFAVFFASFELVKGPMYRSYARWWYSPSYFHPEGRKKSRVLYPSFVLLGGCVAAAAIQIFSYPLSKLHKMHTLRLQAIDQTPNHNRGFQDYLYSYHKTFQAMKKQVKNVANGSWTRWLYGGVFRYTLASMPSTSIGLLVFEIMRIRYAPEPAGGAYEADDDK